jgi:hypothetical protein
VRAILITYEIAEQISGVCVDSDGTQHQLIPFNIDGELAIDANVLNMNVYKKHKTKLLACPIIEVQDENT